MYLLKVGTDPPLHIEAIIEPLLPGELSKLTEADYWFDWKPLAKTELWKLRLVNDNAILGAMSLTYFPKEFRIEINLIASRRDNVGKNKQYDRIAGCLIGWACRLAVKLYSFEACVSLTPKTDLIQHYENVYGLLNAGRQLFVDGKPLYLLIQKFIDDHEP